MFEYINMGDVILSAVIISIIAVRYGFDAFKKERDDLSISVSKFTLVLVIAALIAPFGFSAMTKSSIKTNLKLFKKKKELQCSTPSEKYSVSSKSDWSISGDTFFKGALFIRADKCELLQK